MNHNRQNEENARQLRREMTPWERKLWYCFLKSYPIRFQRQKCIDNYIVDFYCFRAKLVLELDGGGNYEEQAQRYDENRTKTIEKYGLKVLRFCNTDIDCHFYSVCTVIDEEVKKRLHQECSPRP
jgi:very-short-patch-repair endonuclease